MATIFRALGAAFQALLVIATAAVAQRRAQTPVANYHAHLVSEPASRLSGQPALPSVELPSELARVVADFERLDRPGSDSAFAALFTDDALIPGQSGWVRGRQAIRQVCCSRSLRLRPQAFGVADSVGYIAAVSATDSQPSRDLARMLFTLRRNQSGGWLIAALAVEEVSPPIPGLGIPFTANQLIAQLDSAGIRRALVLSVAYWFGAPSSIMRKPGGELSPEQEYAEVRAANDWTAAEAARYPVRLRAFCSFNPLKPYALDELERCAATGNVKGIKLHLANAGADLRKPEDVAQLKRIFRAANDRQLAVVIHMRPRLEPYGREDAELFIREILPEALDIPIQIAHLAGWGTYDDAADQAAAAFAQAIARRGRGTTNLYFDITTIVSSRQPLELRQRIARRIRSIGLRRVVFGSDLGDPAERWKELLELVPLTKAEFETIAGNVTPHLR